MCKSNEANQRTDWGSRTASRTCSMALQAMKSVKVTLAVPPALDVTVNGLVCTCTHAHKPDQNLEDAGSTLSKTSSVQAASSKLHDVHLATIVLEYTGVTIANHRQVSEVMLSR